MAVVVVAAEAVAVVVLIVAVAIAGAIGSSSSSSQRGKKVLNSCRYKKRGAYRSEEGGRAKGLLSDPRSELRLDR